MVSATTATSTASETTSESKSKNVKHQTISNLTTFKDIDDSISTEKIVFYSKTS
jgi:hypothetical protein